MTRPWVDYDPDDPMRPTLRELQWEEWREELCDECAERRADCVCPPGCSCDDEENE